MTGGVGKEACVQPPASPLPLWAQAVAVSPFPIPLPLLAEAAPRPPLGWGQGPRLRWQQRSGHSGSQPLGTPLPYSPLPPPPQQLLGGGGLQSLASRSWGGQGAKPVLLALPPRSGPSVPAVIAVLRYVSLCVQSTLMGC